VARNPDGNRAALTSTASNIRSSNVSTQMLARCRKFDMTFPFGVSIPLLKDVKSGRRGRSAGWSGQWQPDDVVSRAVPPFDNADLRRAMALSLDRKVFVDS
jgi:peptide/nickel transport system substrate-binding protein